MAKITPAEAAKMTDEEWDEICDFGHLPEVICGYMVLAMQSAGFDRDDIAKAVRGMPSILEDFSASDARAAYEQAPKTKPANRDWTKELPCFYSHNGVCQKDGAATQIQEGQCAACPDFRVESWLWEQYWKRRNDEVELTPSYHGEHCRANGKHDGVECQCDNCPHYLDCYPDCREFDVGLDE